jgi:hypothetical protein
LDDVLAVTRHDNSPVQAGRKSAGLRCGALSSNMTCLSRQNGYRRGLRLS